MAGRKYATIGVEDLERRVRAVMADGGDPNPHMLRDRLDDDLKVSFDFENFYDSERDGVGPEGLMGPRTLGGLTFWGMCAGGDWEHPVYFILYWDGKKVRAYVPARGNPWNRRAKAAIGNKPGDEPGDHEFSAPLIRADIEARFGLAAAAQAPVSPVPAAPAATLPSLRSRIEALRFHGTGDEAYELFHATCRLCYLMHGAGMAAEAAALCAWAEMQAVATSAEEWPDDWANGNWG